MRRSWLWIWLCFTSFVGSARAADEIDDNLVQTFEARTYREPTGKRLQYRLFKPESKEGRFPVPLVLMLHGAVGIGDDNRRQFNGGNRVPPATLTAATNQERFPCFMMVPQCPVGGSWSGGSRTSPSDTMRLTLAAMDSVIREFKVDSQRLYLVGLSMGGGGVWDVVALKPDLFAAAVPICGTGDPSNASRLTRLPIWCFHGAADKLVSVDYARTMIAALRKAGGQPRYTEYPGVGHNSYVNAFAEPELLPWLFSQHRKPASSKP